ncbi:hypothetical protein [Chitinophaga sp.]|uniref:hypothetical protein n=1 Tax=Chitinophaga sp. TaxID=1869181 RepID=UPI002F920FD5
MTSILLMNVHLASAQLKLDPVLPPSPNAASLGKFADFPTNLYNGVPQIDIPLWNIDMGKVKVPISLSYHASGVQVSEVPSWTGLGWTLNAGGAITRSVHGLPDDASGGFLSSEVVPECATRPGNVDYMLFQSAISGTGDTEGRQGIIAGRHE